MQKLFKLVEIIVKILVSSIYLMGIDIIGGRTISSPFINGVIADSEN